jgi:hypothetical protein
MLFAQAGGGQAPDFPPELIPVLIVVGLIALAIGLTIQIFYLLTLSRCLNLITPENRRIEPGMVWLNLIPCVSNIWIFFTTIRLADSLRDEYEDRRLRSDGDYGRNLGVIYPILALLGIIPYIGGIFSLASMVCWIMYWVKIAGYSRQLREERSALEDDYDDGL